MAGTPAGTFQSHAVPPVSGADERVESPKRSTLVSQNIGRFPPGSMLAGRYRIIALLERVAWVRSIVRMTSLWINRWR